MSEEVYIPPNCITLDSPDYLSQLRIGIQGPGGSGKTFGAVTFPNPIVGSYDKGLISHVGRKDIIEAKFYEDAFVDKIVSRAQLEPPNRKEALSKWLQTEGQKITKNQTFILDANNGVQAAYHLWYKFNPKISKSGAEDKFTEWRWKVEYYSELMLLLRSLKCSVFMLFHESPDRDSNGNLTGQVRPLLTGQFADELVSHFTDYFRSVVVPKPTVETMAKFKEHFSLDDKMAKEWIDSTPANVKSIYLWQLQSDNVAQCKTSLVGAPKYIPQGYRYFEQHRNKPK